MVRLLLLGLVCAGMDARENPFRPLSDSVAFATNASQTTQPLAKEEVRLPDTARILQSVTFQYQNLDGSIEQKNIPVAKSVDWHQPLVIAQGPNAISHVVSKTVPVVPKVTAVPIVISQATEQAQSASEAPPASVAASSSSAPAQSVVIQEPEASKATPPKPPAVPPQEPPFIAFKSGKEGIEIITKDRVKRHFSLSDPYRIVLDFDHVRNFSPYKTALEAGNAKEVLFGSHEDFYRAVVVLDGSYAYDLTPSPNGYMVRLR